MNCLHPCPFIAPPHKEAGSHPASVAHEQQKQRGGGGEPPHEEAKSHATGERMLGEGVMSQ